MEARVAAQAGVGCRAISVGLYGELGTVFVLELVPKPEVEKWTIDGEIGAYVKALFWTKKFKIIGFDDYYIIGSPETQQTYALRRTMLANAYLVENYAPATAEELENDFKLFIMDGKIYKLSYVDASTLEGYDENNYAKLAISVWDGEAWSAPKMIDDNGFVDLAYSLYTDEKGNTYLIYTQQTKKLTGGAGMEEGDHSASEDIYASASDLCIKVVPITTVAYEDGNFDVKETAKSESYMYLAQYAMVDGVPVMVWAENANNNMFGVSPKNYIDGEGNSHVFATTANSIWMSRYEKGAWSEPICIADELSTVTDLALSSDGYVAYIIDENGDLADNTDRDLYYADLDDCAVKTVDEYANGSVLYVDAEKGGFLLYFDEIQAKEGQTENDGLRVFHPLYELVEQALPNVPVQEFVALRDGDGTIIGIVYAQNKTWKEGESDVTGSALYAIFFENSAWGAPVEIGAYMPMKDKYISFYDAVLTADRKSVLLTLSATDESGEAIGSETVTYTFAPLISIIEHSISYTRSSVSITVKNTGACATAVYAAVNSDSYVLLNKSLASGESGTYEIVLADGSDCYDVTVAMDEKGTGAVTLADIDVSHSDLVPIAKQLLIADSNTLLLALRNNGTLENSGKIVVRVGNYAESEFWSDELVAALESMTLSSDATLGSYTTKDENGNVTEHFFWVVSDGAQKGQIKYHELDLSACGDLGKDAVISIGVLPDNEQIEKGDAADNNLFYLTYRGYTGILEDGEKADVSTEILDRFVSFDPQNPSDTSIVFV